MQEHLEANKARLEELEKAVAAERAAAEAAAPPEAAPAGDAAAPPEAAPADYAAAPPADAAEAGAAADGGAPDDDMLEAAMDAALASGGDDA